LNLSLARRRRHEHGKEEKLFLKESRKSKAERERELMYVTKALTDMRTFERAMNYRKKLFSLARSLLKFFRGSSEASTNYDEKE
jgi:hypothetical protein